MARAATVTQRGRACPGSSSGWPSRAPSAARCGPTPARTSPRWPAVLESARVLARRRHRGASSPAADLGLAYRDSALKHGARRRAAERRHERDVPPRAGRPGRDQGAARRHPALAPGAPAARACPRPAASSATRRRRLGRPAHRRGWGSRAAAIGGAVVSEKHANFIVNDQKGTAADVRRLGEQVRGRRRRATASSSPSRSCSSATGPAGRGDRRRGTPRDRGVAVRRRGPARRAVGRARRVARLGHGHRRGAARGAGHQVAGWLIDLDGAWWWLPAGTGATTGRRAAYDDPAALGADGPAARRRGARTGWQPRDPRRSSSSRSTARSARTARSRRCSTRPAWPTRAPASRPRRSGMDKALFKRLCRALGLPVVVASRSAPTRWARRPGRACVAELEAFAAGAADPRLMVKPAASELGIGITIVHRPDEPARAGRIGASGYDDLALAEAYLAGARELEVGGRRQRRATGSRCTGRARSCPATSSTTTPPSTAPACRETPITGPRSPTAQRATLRQARARGVPRHRRRRASRASTSCWPASGSVVSEINTIPGFTPISLFPMLPAEGGYDFGDVCERIVELAIERQRPGRPTHLSAADLPR